jgi:hypothetical protein
MFFRWWSWSSVVVVICGRGHLWSWLAYLAYPTEALKNKLLKRLCINFFYVFSILELKLLRCCFIAGKFAASGDKTLWLISKFQAKQWPNPENGSEAIIRLMKMFYSRLSPSPSLHLQNFKTIAGRHRHHFRLW